MSVSTQLELTRPKLEDADCYQVNDHIDGSETGSGHQRDDDQSVEGSASEVNNEEDGLDWSSPSTPDFRGNGKHGLGRVG